MKTTILILFMLLTTAMGFSQKIEATLHLKDGTTKTGFIKYGLNPFAPNLYVTDKVKYRKTITSKEITEYAYSLISRIDVLEEGKLMRSLYFRTTEKNPKIVLELLLVYQEGEVNLYAAPVDVITPNDVVQSGKPYVVASVSAYYLQKDGEAHVFKVFPGKVMGISSEKLMQDYFEDCPKLVELIGRKAFKMYVANTPSLADQKSKNRLIEIVKYYNTNCAAEK